MNPGRPKWSGRNVLEALATSDSHVALKTAIGKMARSSTISRSILFGLAMLSMAILELAESAKKKRKVNFFFHSRNLELFVSKHSLV